MSAAVIESPPHEVLSLMWAAQAEGEQDAAGHEKPASDFQPEAHIVASSVPVQAMGLVSAPAVAAGTSVAQLGRAAVAFAESRVGWTEQPSFSNLIFAWEDMKPEWQGNPWCAASWCDAWARQGIDLRTVIDNPYYCPYLESLASNHGAWRPRGSGYDPTSGDAVLYGSGSIATHVGMAAPTSANYSGYRAIEGNTMPQGATGSQTNGNGQYIRYRPANKFLRGWIDMGHLVPALKSAGLLKVTEQVPDTAKFSGTRAVQQPVKTPRISFRATSAAIALNVTQAEAKKPLTPSPLIRAVQMLLLRNSLYAGKLDGQWGPATTEAYAHLQRIYGYTGAKANGIPGPLTFPRLMQWRNAYIVTDLEGA